LICDLKFYLAQFLKQPKPFKFFFSFMLMAQPELVTCHALAIVSDCHHGCPQALITN